MLRRELGSKRLRRHYSSKLIVWCLINKKPLFRRSMILLISQNSFTSTHSWTKIKTKPFRFKKQLNSWEFKSKRTSSIWINSKTMVTKSKACWKQFSTLPNSLNPSQTRCKYNQMKRSSWTSRWAFLNSKVESAQKWLTL